MSVNKVQVLEQVLGTSRKVGQSDLIFYCPFCKHRKPKLQVHLDLGHWRCWVCNKKGRSLVILLRYLHASKNLIDKIKSSSDILIRNTKQSKEKEFDLELPSLFHPIYKKNKSIDYKHALVYLKKRGITEYDILRYNIGFCEDGDYSSMIIIPSYDCNYDLNYFVGRSFYDVDYKHKNPKVSKNIIGFESLINWSEPITLVEGAFDAISVKRNCIPLFGKYINDRLVEKILSEGVTDINIFLDADALAKAVDTVEFFMNSGLNVKLVEPTGKDPNELGYEKSMKLLSETETFNFSKLIKLKMQL